MILIFLDNIGQYEIKSRFTIHDLISMLSVVVLITGVTIIITIQFFRIRENRQLFLKLARRFNLDKYDKLDNNSIVDKLISSLKINDKNKILNQNLYEFISYKLIENKVFIHYTRGERTAKEILEKGFKYFDSFYKTTQEINDVSVDLTYKIQLYRNYGEFLIIICFPKVQYLTFMDSGNDILIDNGLSKMEEGTETEYILSREYIVGYYDFRTNDIIQNKFD